MVAIRKCKILGVNRRLTIENRDTFRGTYPGLRLRLITLGFRLAVGQQESICCTEREGCCLQLTTYISFNNTAYHAFYMEGGLICHNGAVAGVFAL